MLTAGLLAGMAHAATTIGTDSEVGADFGLTEYSTGSSGNVSMGSNGAITYPAGFTGSGLGVAGQFRIAVGGFGAAGAQYTVSCRDSDALAANAGGDTISIEADFVVTAGTRTVFGGGNACNGLGTDYGPYTGTSRTIYIGTRLNIPPGFNGSGTYSTGNASGQAITFEVVLL